MRTVDVVEDRQEAQSFHSRAWSGRATPRESESYSVAIKTTDRRALNATSSGHLADVSRVGQATLPVDRT